MDDEVGNASEGEGEPKQRRCASFTIMESCSLRRMLSLVLIFLLVSLTLFLFEYYIEEGEVSGSGVLKKLIAINEGPTRSSSGSDASSPHPQKMSTRNKTESGKEWESVPSSHCYMNEPFTVIESCVKCSPFELEAVKSEYCLKNGYYDKLNCTRSGHLGLRPCPSKGDRSTFNFHLFSIFAATLFASSYYFVHWRRGVLDRRAYLRLQQQIAS